MGPYAVARNSVFTAFCRTFGLFWTVLHRGFYLIYKNVLFMPFPCHNPVVRYPQSSERTSAEAPKKESKKEGYHMEYWQNPIEEPKKKNRLSVGMGLFITCVVLTALIGLFAGLLISNYTHESTLLAQMDTVEKEQEPSAQATQAPEATAAAGLLAASPAFKNDAQYTRAEIIEKCAPSVVGIDITYTAANSFGGYFGYGYGYGYGNGGTQEATASGSGVILTTDGYIATCAHVVEDANTIQVTLNNDQTYDAVLVGTDSKNDIAIIKVEAENLIAAELGESDMLTVGEDVIAIGNPLGELRGTATAGIISATSRSITVENQEMTLIQTDAAINSGNSGGGLFNAAGQLIGIVNAKVSSSGVEGLGFAIPLNSVLKEINDLVSFGYVKDRPYLGVTTQNVTLRNDYGWFSSGSGVSCVQVVQVIKGGTADTAGVQAGDLILQLGDVEITSNTVLTEAIQAYKPGDTAKLTIQRNGEKMTLSVVFQEYAPDAQVG